MVLPEPRKNKTLTTVYAGPPMAMLTCMHAGPMTKLGSSALGGRPGLTMTCPLDVDWPLAGLQCTARICHGQVCVDGSVELHVTFHETVSAGDIASRYLHCVTENDTKWRTAMDVKAWIGQELKPDMLTQTGTSKWIQGIVDNSEHQDFGLVMKVFGIIEDAKAWAAAKAGERLMAELEVTITEMIQNEAGYPEHPELLGSTGRTEMQGRKRNAK